jgi:protein-disulfide isomerase
MSKIYGSFARAETAADEEAALRNGKWAVVEDFYSGYFLVLPTHEADDYVANNYAGIQYETGAS